VPLSSARRPLWGILALLVGSSLACGGLDTQDCIGAVVHGGQTYQPESGVPDAVDAQRMACNQYCLLGDDEYEAMYGIWVSSPAGDASVSKKDAIYSDQRLLDYVTITCADRCVEAVAAGQMQGSVTCQ